MYATTENRIGTPPTIVTLTSADWSKFLGRDTNSAGTVPLPYPGQVILATDPIFGECAFMLAYGLASLAIGEAVMIGAGYAVTRTIAATRGIVGISMSANTDSTALSWFCVRGQVPAKLLAAAANTNLFTSATAGNLTTTVVATQGVTGAVSLTALAAAIGTKLVGTVNGSPNLAVPDVSGLYVGCGVTGTGIPGSTTVLAIGYGGPMLGLTGPMPGNVTLSANATATGNVTGSFIHGAAFALIQLGHPIAANLG